MSSSLLMGCAVAHGQNRILETPGDTDGPRMQLADGVSPRARAALDLGLVAPDTALSSVTLRFNQTAAQTAALGQLLADQQNSASPSYHQWLTPEQFGQRFGLSQTDLATVTAWLQKQGLTITTVGRSRTFVTVSGSATQVQAAFQTPIHQVEANGNLHFANLNSPSLPASIAAVVGGITGLNDFRLKPHNHPHTESAPQFTSSISGNHFIAPGDFYTIYDINPLLKSSVDGSGVTIAVVGQTDISLADVAAFRSASGLAANVPTVKLVGKDPGTGTAGDVIEAHLDVEWSGAVAPAATILYVNSTDVVNGSLTAAVDNNLAPIVTLSYGNCETAFGASNIASFNALFQQANAQGQTILSASGDSGATDCDFQVAIASGGLAVDYPSSSPNVTGIGGTMFNEGGATYFTPANGANSGSAISYIPEAVWNESGNGNLGAGGGGASVYLTKPVWQTGAGVPNDFARDVPDLSLNSAASHDGYLYCATGSCTNGYRNAAGNLQVVGGTSVATPAFAGILALLEQKLGSRIGNANPVIYGLANSSFSSAVFHDVTTGNNTSPCKAGSPGCPSGGSLGYNAGTGYDLATGWGSVDGFNFVNDWALVQPAGSGAVSGTNASTTTLTPPTASANIGTSVSFTASVASNTTGITTMPTGSVQLLVDNVVSGNPVSLANGSAAFSLSTSSLSSGGHVVTAAYSGDGVYAGSKASATLDLSSTTAADFALTPAAASASARSGSAAAGVTFTVSALHGFTGNVTLSAASTVAIAGSYSLSINPVVLSSSTTSGNTVLTLFASPSGTGGGTGALSRAGATSARLGSQHTMPWLPLGSGVAVAGLFFFGLPRRRRARWSVLAISIVAAGMLTMTGCGSGVSSSPPATTVATPAGAAPGTYSVLVSASANDSTGRAIVHTATVTFVVQ